MKRYIKLIENIINQGGFLVNNEDLRTQSFMNEKITNKELKECDLYFEGKLPDDYKSFLQIYNGGELFNYNDLGGFEFFSSKRLISENELQRTSFAKEWEHDVILFSTFISGDAEYLGFRINDKDTYDILDITLYEPFSEWRVIGRSFDEFVEKLIEKKGKAFWLDNYRS